MSMSIFNHGFREIIKYYNSIITNTKFIGYLIYSYIYIYNTLKSLKSNKCQKLINKRS